jgi:hypothetical protein
VSITPAPLFHPYSRLCKIKVLGKDLEVPEKNMLLRGFQFLAPETIPYGRFCWNEECQYCRVVYRRGPDGQPHQALSCKLLIDDGLEILEMADELVHCMKPVMKGEPPPCSST